MNVKQLSAAIVAVQLFPLLAFAQAEETGRSTPVLVNLLWTFLPIALIGGLLFWFLRRVQSGPRAKRTEEYMDRHEEHMERVEQSLERIARALERKDTGTGGTKP